MQKAQKPAGKLQSELNNAVISVNVALVKQLLAAGASPNGPPRISHGVRTPLTTAAHTGNVDIVTILLDAGADPNLGTDYGLTPLLMATSSEVVERLLSHGADPNLPDREGDTPLMWHANYGDIDILNKLLEYGAKINAQGRHGRTALHAALESTFRTTARTVARLLEAGADPNARYQKDGRTPLQILVTFDMSMPHLLHNLCALLEAGASPSLRTPPPESKTALELLAAKTTYSTTQVARAVATLLDAGRVESFSKQMSTFVRMVVGSEGLATIAQLAAMSDREVARLLAPLSLWRPRKKIP